MATWDADSFFTLHDYNADGVWQADEFQRTYGLMDASNRAMTDERKAQVTRELMALLDGDGDGDVSRAEWAAFVAHGRTLPDMGTGPGHHGDDEYEYEIHHWEKYHDANTKLEDLTHPEDVEHFKLHEDLEKAQEKQQVLDRQSVVKDKIPAKFRRHPLHARAHTRIHTHTYTYIYTRTRAEIGNRVLLHVLVAFVVVVRRTSKTQCQTPGANVLTRSTWATAAVLAPRPSAAAQPATRRSTEARRASTSPAPTFSCRCSQQAGLGRASSAGWWAGGRS